MHHNCRLSLLLFLSSSESPSLLFLRASANPSQFLLNSSSTPPSQFLTIITLRCRFATPQASTTIHNHPPPRRKKKFVWARMGSDDDAVREATKMEEEEASSSASAPEKLVNLSPGSTNTITSTMSRRMKANPLKHVAHLLRQKLVAAHGSPCNMLQVALELHSQAQDKHNTTLRRIYDVVNVCEGAGVLARTGPFKTPELKGTPAASDQTLLQRYFPFRRTGKRSLRGGSAIQWVGSSSDEVLGEHGDTQKPLLEKEKGYTVDRIFQKRRLCDTLSKQVAILQKLMEENQEKSKVSGDRDIYADLSSLPSMGGFGDVDYVSVVEKDRGCPPKRLHLPFVMLATNPAANVDICMTGDPPYEVHLQLDQRYCLMDHIQMIKLLPEGRRYGVHEQP